MDYKILSKKTSRDVGPGCYDIQKTLELLNKKPCLSNIKHSFYGKRAGKPGYIYVGN